jgi:hypothetical protein
LNPAGPGSLSHTPLSSGDRRKRATGVAAFAAVSFLLLALIASPQGGSATSSLVMVTASELEKEVPAGESVGFIIIFSNGDSEQSRTLELAHQFMDGEPEDWSAWWTTTDDTPVSNGTLHSINAGGILQFHLYVEAPAGSAGNSRSVWAFAWEGAVEEAERNQTMRPSGSPLLLAVNSGKPYGAELELEAASAIIYQEQPSTFDFTLRSTGVYSDDYTIAIGDATTLPAGTVSLTDTSGRLKGSYDAVSAQDRTAAGTFTVSPDRNLLPGDYTLEIEASFDNGVTASAQMALTAPVPDFGFVAGSFRITSTTEVKSNEPVSVEVKVTNNGGNVDVNSAFTESIEVRAGGDALGQQSSFVTSLKHGEEARVSFVLTPTNGGELEIKLEIDPQGEVVEKDESNNVMLQSLSVEAEPEEKKEDGGLIPGPGLLAVATGIALVAVLRRRR